MRMKPWKPRPVSMMNEELRRQIAEKRKQKIKLE